MVQTSVDISLALLVGQSFRLGQASSDRDLVVEAHSPNLIKLTKRYMHSDMIGVVGYATPEAFTVLGFKVALPGTLCLSDDTTEMPASEDFSSGTYAMSDGDLIDLSSLYVMTVDSVVKNTFADDVAKMGGLSTLSAKENTRLSEDTRRANQRNQRAAVRMLGGRFIILLDRPVLGASSTGMSLFKTSEIPGTVSPVSETGKEMFIKLTHDPVLAGITDGTSLNIHGYNYVVKSGGVKQPDVITTFGAQLLANPG
jgi:hypothetical protein